MGSEIKHQVGLDLHLCLRLPASKTQCWVLNVVLELMSNNHVSFCSSVTTAIRGALNCVLPLRDFFKSYFGFGGVQCYAVFHVLSVFKYFRVISLFCHLCINLLEMEGIKLGEVIYF